MLYTENYRLNRKQWTILLALFFVVGGILFITKPTTFIEVAVVMGLALLLLTINSYFQSASLEIDTTTIWIREKKNLEKLLIKEVAEFAYGRYEMGGDRGIAVIVKVHAPTYESLQSGEAWKAFGMNSVQIKPWIPGMLVFIPFGVLITWKNKTQKTFIPSAHPERLMQALQSAQR